MEGSMWGLASEKFCQFFRFHFISSAESVIIMENLNFSNTKDSYDIAHITLSNVYVVIKDNINQRKLKAK